MTRLGTFPSTLPAYQDAKTRQVEVGAGLHNVMILLETGTRSFEGGAVVSLTEYEYSLIDDAVFAAGVLIERGEVVTIDAPAGTDNDIRLVTVPVALADIAAGEVVSITPGFAGRIVSIQALVTTPVTTAAKAATLDFKIGTAPVGRNEVQTITISATGGTWTATWNGQTATGLAWDITAAALQTALEALSNIAVGDVVVTGGPGATAPLTITFKGTLAGTNVAAFTTGAGGLTGGGGTATVATPTAGDTAVLALTSANSTPEGGSVASSGTLVTTDAVFDADDEIVVSASAVTTFVEGAVVLVLTTVATA